MINLQGKLDCTYVVGFYFNAKPQRANLKDRWPSSPEENLDRLGDAGIPYDRGVPKCANCGGVYFIVPETLLPPLTNSTKNWVTLSRAARWRGTSLRDLRSSVLIATKLDIVLATAPRLAVISLLAVTAGSYGVSHDPTVC